MQQQPCLLTRGACCHSRESHLPGALQHSGMSAQHLRNHYSRPYCQHSMPALPGCLLTSRAR